MTKIEAALGIGFGATVGLAAAISSAAVGVMDQFLSWPVWIAALASAWGGAFFSLVRSGGRLRPTRVGGIFVLTLVLTIAAAIVWQHQHPPVRDTALDFIELFVGPVALVLAIPLGIAAMVLARSGSGATGALPKKFVAWIGAGLIVSGLVLSLIVRTTIGSHEGILLLAFFMVPAIPVLGAAVLSNHWHPVSP